MYIFVTVLLLFVFCVIWVLMTRPVNDSFTKPIEISNDLVYFHSLDFDNQLAKYQKENPRRVLNEISPIPDGRGGAQAFIVSFKKKFEA